MDPPAEYLYDSAMQIRVFSWNPEQPDARDLVCGHWSQGPEYRTLRPEGSPNWLMMLTRKGGCVLRGADGEALAAGAGSILLYQPGAHHDYATAPELGTWEFAWTHFLPLPHWTFLPLGKPCWPGLSRLDVSPAVLEKILEPFWKTFSPSPQNTALHPDYAAHCLEAMFLRIRDDQSKEDNRLDPRIHHAMSLLQRNPEQELSIEDLARRASLSPSRFAHLFTASCGQSPRAYHETLRLQRAAFLLRSTTLSISEIADTCGYEDPFYFSRRFRRHSGVSPRRFRQEAPIWN